MRLLRAPSNLTLNVSRDGASTTFLGNPFQCFTTLIIKKLFLISSLNLPSFGLKPLFLVLSQQALVKREVFHPSDHFCVPPLDPLHQVHVLLVLRAPELDAVLQVRSHQSRAEGQNPLPRPAGHAAFDAAQDMVCFLGCKCTLLAHVQLFIHQYPQVLLCRAALNPFIPQPVLILGVAPIQVQDPALGLVEPLEFHTGPLLQLVQVPLDDIPSLRHVNRTTQFDVVCKLAEVYKLGEIGLGVAIAAGGLAGRRSAGGLDSSMLVSCLPFLIHLGIESSCTLWKMSLKICQLCSAPLSPREGPDFTLHLTHIPQDCKLHQCMIPAAWAASNLDITN
ncbi:hypothetical protein QYF61_024442 [Mycteria americana]|uniref:Uncharacterized protein n=1 Tax=Mycteria americana TaxID=33587 RepID=A0AAN7S8K4_MYCAM|nr:hypothetical protein QYF61_024442 [Mycteria americana]